MNKLSARKEVSPVFMTITTETEEESSHLQDGSLHLNTG